MTQAAHPRALESPRPRVPFAPARAKLEESVSRLVSAAGVRRQDAPPFDAEGDTSWRTIPGEAAAKELRCDDAHHDHACVDRDLDRVFPIDRVRALAAEGRVGGSPPVTSLSVTGRPPPRARSVRAAS